MVFYHTSANVKMLKMIISDFANTNDISPHEYIKSYIEKCPDSIEDAKVSWIAETFLSFDKHRHFLREVASHLNQELSEENQEYFMILFHAIIFRIEPKDMELLYKCLFNLSKSLLDIFTKFLSNNEVLTFITQVAENRYDTNYITEKIIRPLFEWQPYIGEMEHNYAAYVKKIESRKIKSLTVPIQPNFSVLNRKSKEVLPVPQPSQQSSVPTTPPNLLNSMRKKNPKMLTKSTIDAKLKQIHEKNKEKATNLLNDVKRKDLHYARTEKSDKYLTRVANIKEEMENSLMKSIKKPIHTYNPKSPPLIKDTATTVKRLHNRIKMEEEEELKWLQNVICYRNTGKFEEIAEKNRQERERERLLDIERKHLMGLITYEEAVLSKKKLVDENKKKYEDFLKEKQVWNEEIERWRREEIEKHKKQIEKQCFTELNALKAKNEVTNKKKEATEMVKKESETIKAKLLQEQRKELEGKINMIKEIKALELIARKARVPKIIDLTDTARLGLLCEMSIAELQERLNAMKIKVKDELESKKKAINKEKQQAKQELEDTKDNIKKYMDEQAQIRKYNKKLGSTSLNGATADDANIKSLKKVLQEKRVMRMKLSQPPLPV